MKKTSFCIFVIFITFSIPAFSQDAKRGTIKVAKPFQKKYLISKGTSQGDAPQRRIFRSRIYNYNLNEYFPKEYGSDLFPVVFNSRGWILADVNTQDTGNQIISFDYDMVASQVLQYTSNTNMGGLNQPLRELSRMAIGSCIWIRNLVYVDKDGIVHQNEIGEFKVEKVK